MTGKCKSATSFMLAFVMSCGIAKAEVPAGASVSACGNEYGAKLGSKFFVVPSMGMENTAEVGQVIASTYKADVMDGTSNYAFSLDETINLSGRSFGQDFTITIPPLEIKMAPDLVYRPRDSTFKYANDSSPRTGISKPDVFLKVNLPSKEVLVHAKIGFGEERFVVGQATLVTTPPCAILGRDSFQRELVYTGVAKGVVTLMYREFSGNWARPAFSQELHFDLAEGNEIGYKGARFQIIKANNLGITYFVTQGLD